MLKIKQNYALLQTWFYIISVIFVCTTKNPFPAACRKRRMIDKVLNRLGYSELLPYSDFGIGYDMNYRCVSSDLMGARRIIALDNQPLKHGSYIHIYDRFYEIFRLFVHQLKAFTATFKSIAFMGEHQGRVYAVVFNEIKQPFGSAPSAGAQTSG